MKGIIIAIIGMTGIALGFASSSNHITEIERGLYILLSIIFMLIGIIYLPGETVKLEMKIRKQQQELDEEIRRMEG